MPRLPDRIEPLARAVLAEDRRGDVITAASLLVIALGLDALGLVRTSWSGPPDVPVWWFVVPAVVGCTALVWRRIHPLGALGVATVAFVADVALGGSVGLIVILWEALYAVHLHGRRAARRVAVAGVTVAVLAVSVLAGVASGELRGAVLGGLQASTLLVMPMWWGANVRQGRELAAAAEERERLERERGTALLHLAEAARHDAVRAERTAVARDLHDVVASHLSAITITSGAALAGAAEPDRDRAALRAVRAESLASLQDMQAMIRVLRAETTAGSAEGSSAEPGARQDPEPGPRPGTGPGVSDLLAAPRVAQLAPVLDQARLAGLDLAVSDPDGVLTGAAVLPAAVDHAVYRVVREALTNVHKHGGAHADLSFAADGQLEVEVHDVGARPGDPAHPPVGAGGTGLGLVSMRERVEAVGGTFEAGPARDPGETAGAGWRVRATLPLPRRADTSDGVAPGRRA
ncbi:sensor histidine kinase [Promicromonospora sp. NPDC050880]|uniref:sensor histidine kinase n=1 Tax=Promicromonospora sp. NPDC050880 TaxID=3364406 RepID=UPI00378C3ADA